ncbi:hypothetical protein [Paenibacillus sp. GCM10027626]|uniref:hypothetical protein n=1 Tax=Paenibacillus sp. GCM10027626 TaxID=3273411 RepID=UPI00362FDE46
MKECLFYFKAKGQDVHALRAVIMLEENKEPTVVDFIHCFDQLGYNTVPENKQRLTFRRVDTPTPYTLEVTKIKIKGETEDTMHFDGELRELLKELIQV